MTCITELPRTSLAVVNCHQPPPPPTKPCVDVVTSNLMWASICTICHTFLGKPNTRIRCVGCILRNGRIRNSYKFFSYRCEKKRQFRRCRCKWEGNIEVNLKFLCMDRIKLAQGRVYWQAPVLVVMNFKFYYRRRICWLDE